MLTITDLAKVNSERLQAMIDRLIKTLDPDYPSAVIPPRDSFADSMYNFGVGGERQRPQFVIDDDNGWTPL